ncbi:MAG: superoxide dismutase, Fe-Mn family [Parcubacteria group bacterium Gr01-1014_73]|nr:MAG: superoxide dismutase, Fe-Mn family [Parcubacteria group bacterium Gr01-1014_73]
MKKFEEAKFEIPKLKGISEKNIEEHLKLYAGYVKNANLVLEKIEEFSKDLETNAYVFGELHRRFSFEFNGMVNHKYYFEQFEGKAKALSPKSFLGEMLARDYGSFENWLARFKTVAFTRGIGWAMLYYDPLTKRLLNAWVDEQHLGQLNGCQTILALDMWEHAFVADYQPSGKKNYIDDFFANLNWEVVEKNFSKAKTA